MSLGKVWRSFLRTVKEGNMPLRLTAEILGISYALQAGIIIGALLYGR
jgi:hypothetical protein